MLQKFRHIPRWEPSFLGYVIQSCSPSESIKARRKNWKLLAIFCLLFLDDHNIFDRKEDDVVDRRYLVYKRRASYKVVSLAKQGGQASEIKYWRDPHHFNRRHLLQDVFCIEEATEIDGR